MIVYVNLLVAVVGLVIWLASTNPKAAEAGRIMLWCGLLAFLLLIEGARQIPFLR